MLKIAYDPIYAHPLPPGHRFPMLKYELIPAQLLHEGLIPPDSLFSPGYLDEEVIYGHMIKITGINYVTLPCWQKNNEEQVFLYRTN